MKLFAATGNPDKLREIRQILSGSPWILIGKGGEYDYPEPEENGISLAENALIKAREGFKRTGLLSLADDSGLEVEAIGGAPGVHSARFAGPSATYADNVNLLLQRLSGVPHPRRKAAFRCVMALVGEGVEEIWEGSVEGCITEAPEGRNGFGYDPVFWAPELQMTFAAAAAEDKNRVSHRGRALAGLKAKLRQLAADRTKAFA